MSKTFKLSPEEVAAKREAHTGKMHAAQCKQRQQARKDNKQLHRLIWGEASLSY